MAFPPTDKSLQGLLRDYLQRIVLLERRLAIGGGAPTSGQAAPTTVPSTIGAIYVNTVTKKVYVATGTDSVSDWTAVN